MHAMSDLTTKDPTFSELGVNTSGIEPTKKILEFWHWRLCSQVNSRQRFKKLVASTLNISLFLDNTGIEKILPKCHPYLPIYTV
jgi:hypothetical protein